MQLAQWVHLKGGDVAAAKLLNTSRNRVYSWRVYKAMPRPSQMKDIVARSGGAVKYKDIVLGYLAGHEEYKKSQKKVKRGVRPKSKGTVAKFNDMVKDARARQKPIDPGF